MQEIIFNKKDYKSYEDFYVDCYNKLNGNQNHDFDFCGETLRYNPDILHEFLWGYHKENIKFIFLNFDKAKLATQKTIDAFEYSLIFQVFYDHVTEFPNNKLEFRIEQEKSISE